MIIPSGAAKESWLAIGDGRGIGHHRKGSQAASRRSARCLLVVVAVAISLAAFSPWTTGHAESLGTFVSGSAPRLKREPGRSQDFVAPVAKRNLRSFASQPPPGEGFAASQAIALFAAAAILGVTSAAWKASRLRSVPPKTTERAPRHVACKAASSVSQIPGRFQVLEAAPSQIAYKGDKVTWHAAEHTASDDDLLESLEPLNLHPGLMPNVEAGLEFPAAVYSSGGSLDEDVPAAPLSARLRAAAATVRAGRVRSAARSSRRNPRSFGQRRRHRRVGAKLQRLGRPLRRYFINEARSRLYDTSLLRNKVQVGLRLPRAHRSGGRSREVRTLMAAQPAGESVEMITEPEEVR